MQIEAVDLFCGVGGLTAGLIKSGSKLKQAMTLQMNVVLLMSIIIMQLSFIRMLLRLHLLKFCLGTLQALFAYWLGVLLVSLSQLTKGKDTTKDKKWPLLYHFSRLIKKLSQNW
jgi:DNA (cytosine-5)-methyltransferase 1